MSEEPLVYTPPQPAAPAAPVQYQLETTVVGKPVPTGPTVLQDGNGNKLRAPWPPKKNCKRCYGRGFVGLDTQSNELIPCRKCYPWKT